MKYGRFLVHLYGLPVYCDTVDQVLALVHCYMRGPTLSPQYELAL